MQAVKQQNVNGAVAVVIIVVTLALFFGVFSRMNSPEAPVTFVPVPDAPQIPAEQLQNMYKGMKPLGAYTLLPPLSEDRGVGVRISAVEINTPADRAGLKPGDLILAVDGMKSKSRETVIMWLQQAKPEKKYPVLIERAGKKLTLQVTGIVPPPVEERAQF